MRINICKSIIDSKYLIEEAQKFETREVMMPYLIMNTQTMHALDDVYVDSNSEYKLGILGDYKILINNDLSFGDVDIR